LIKLSNPLNTESTSTKARVPTATPRTDIAVILFTAFLLFEENK
jgi:hypothetical protein